VYLLILYLYRRQYYNFQSGLGVLSSPKPQCWKLVEGSFCKADCIATGTKIMTSVRGVS
jgi:hypothetical protein